MEVLQFNLENRSLAYSWSHGVHPNPLVVLHGLGDSAIHTYSSRFATTVLHDTPSLFVDLPGFGEGSATDTYPSNIETMALDVVCMLSDLKLSRPTIFAHSMGANIALCLAHHQPEIVGNLILAEPLLHPENSVLAGSIAKHSEQTFVTSRYNMLVRATSLQTARGDEVAKAFLQTLKMANPVAMYRSAASLLGDRDPGFQEMLINLEQPVSLLVGSRTKVTTANLERENMTIIRVPNAGHFMMVESATETACAILEVVNRMQFRGNP